MGNLIVPTERADLIVSARELIVGDMLDLDRASDLLVDREWHRISSQKLFWIIRMEFFGKTNQVLLHSGSEWPGPLLVNQDRKFRIYEHSPDVTHYV